MKRESMQAWRRRQAETERMIDDAVAHVRAARDAELDARRDAAAVDRALAGRFTADDLAGAAAVRDRIGWHRVVKVNAKSVTVATAYSWTERIPIEQVREWR